MFALKNKQHQVSGLYFRSTTNNDTAKHYYLKDRQGIYPGYPKIDTQKLIITEAVIDAATLLKIPAITETYSIVTAYGTNGLNQEIKPLSRNCRNWKKSSLPLMQTRRVRRQ